MVQRGPSFEIDFVLFFDLVKDLIYRCISDKEVRSKTVKALLITSQANTFVPVCADFKPLRHGIVWLDQRAKAEADHLRKELLGYATYSGFGQPLPGLLASKLLWLKSHESEVFGNAKFFPSIHEYLVYGLTRTFFTDTTTFGMSGMYNFREKKINSRLLQLLELDKDYFPQIENAAEKAALISREMAITWGIQDRFPVYLCGNDQCASASGSGLRDVGDITINFGSALVLFSLTKGISKNIGADQISGQYPITDDYFLLSYTPDFGIVIRALKKRFFQEEDTYDPLFQTYLNHPDITEIKPWSCEEQTAFKTKVDGEQFCSGIIKYYINQLKKHIADLRHRGHVKNIFLSGAITKSDVWIQIIEKEICPKVIVNNQEDAGMLGALNIYLSKN